MVWYGEGACVVSECVYVLVGLDRGIRWDVWLVLKLCLVCVLCVWL